MLCYDITDAMNIFRSPNYVFLLKMINAPIASPRIRNYLPEDDKLVHAYYLSWRHLSAFGLSSFIVMSSQTNIWGQCTMIY